MSLPHVEAGWCAYLGASTAAVYPRRPGDIRVTLLTSVRQSRVHYSVSVLVELWAAPAHSDSDAIRLHERVVAADSRVLGDMYVTDVQADVPRPYPDPDAEDLDRYQFTATHITRTTI